MSYDPVANYELTDIEEIPHGEMVVTASGETVFVRRPGGRVRFRATFQGHFSSHPAGFFTVGEVFSHQGIEYMVEQIKLSGLHRIKAVDGEFFDGRSYEIQALSTRAYDGSLDIDEPMAGE
ncbi:MULTISPECIES: hypothetical protein [Dethiosulfovibrio]|uniref:Uncharacterized protein n=2 Tax=Dethiosulfovibrio TaxID=47054 RepID=A0ABS9EQV4_9BACT|nr:MULTISPECIES: hypothetical protein [Dethiosulfovibrio]MCF4115143.1 hypothetical protein [Dethiosulfovibrio russensis]MCF4143577.1 hypothetical protein [Dethiosulfovibrio marinus]MCF4146214.1 hypothetical protein [Dethiosulfovibrio acidaminovorans]